MKRTFAELQQQPEWLEAVKSTSGLQVPGATLAQIEKHAILATLISVDGCSVQAADILQISVRTIQYRLREYGLSRGRAASSARTCVNERS